MVIAVAGAMVIGEWEEAAVVVFLFALAQWLESQSMDRARGAIRALMDLAPVEARIERPRRRAAGAGRRVLPGEMMHRPARARRFALDGTVRGGRSDVNQAPITGESLPVEKAPGDEVFAGTINGHGALGRRGHPPPRDTTLARIIHLVEQAQAQRAPMQQFVDRFARVYTPAVVVLAAGRRRRAARSAGGDVRHLDLPRARAAGDLVPVRAGDLDAGVDRLGAGRRGAPRRADQGRRRARAARRGPLRGVRQDRHADRAAQSRVGADATRSTGHRRVASCCAAAASVETQSEHPIARRSCRGAAAAASRSRRRRRASGRCPGLGVEGRVDGAACCVRQPRGCSTSADVLDAALDAPRRPHDGSAACHR